MRLLKEARLQAMKWQLESPKQREGRLLKEARFQATKWVSTAKGEETTEGSKQWSDSWSLQSKGRGDYWRKQAIKWQLESPKQREGRLLKEAWLQATKWVSTAKGEETTEGSSIASNEATVGVSTALSSYVSVIHDPSTIINDNYLRSHSHIHSTITQSSIATVIRWS